MTVIIVHCAFINTTNAGVLICTEVGLKLRIFSQ